VNVRPPIGSLRRGDEYDREQKNEQQPLHPLIVGT
jgi:hypothetical protein